MKSRHLTKREWREYYRQRKAYKDYADRLQDEHPIWFE